MLAGIDAYVCYVVLLYLWGVFRCCLFCLLFAGFEREVLLLLWVLLNFAFV